ncbi:hypothetical protein D3C77_525890 [compost metagenome]
MVFFNQPQAADTRADSGTNTIGVRLVDIQPRILHGLHAGDDAVLNEGIHLARIFARDEIFTVKILYQASKTGCIGSSIEMVDQADATLTGKKSIPCGLYRIADRRQHAKSGHNYTTLRHVCPPGRDKKRDSWD